MSRMPWFIGGALAAYWWLRPKPRGSSSAAESFAGPLPGRWVWPVPAWKGRSPTISDGFNSPRFGFVRHGGVDIMFKRMPGDPFAPGSPNGSKQFVMPDDVPVLAASDGVVWSATKTPRGYAVVIDHGPNKLATFYTHLEKLSVTPTTRGEAKQRVRAGDAIGTVGASPIDPERIKHLHFELWLGGPTNAVDPSIVMRGWSVAPDPRTVLVARNASLNYRPIGSPGEPYPQWVRDLKGESGVYVIRQLRDGDSPKIVYVGSSVGRLYHTLTRHFQAWRRWKGFWKGQYAEGHDRYEPGRSVAL